MIVKRRLRLSAAVLLTLLSTVSQALAKSSTTENLTGIKIGNFGRIDDSYYRGAQPFGNDYADLAALGIKTVIDLTGDGRSDEQAFVERAGMKFYRIPLTTSNWPSDAAVTQFLKLVNDRANQPVFVHCQGGRHRTGTMTAVYRMTHYGWTADQAYTEMKKYHFEGFLGHPALKKFVYDFYTRLDRARIANDRQTNQQRTNEIGAGK
jgi:protein tyrosine/serine phosphatase